MKNWSKFIKFNPAQGLLDNTDDALYYFISRDILQKHMDPIESIWQLQAVRKIFKKQLPNGSFKYPGKRTVSYPDFHYPLVETWKQLRFLVDQYELNKQHMDLQRAAEYIFSLQTNEGDFRGFIGNQYATYYTGALIYLLIKAGYADDPRIKKGMEWLLHMRQNDQGWTIPVLTRDFSWEEITQLSSCPATPVEPDRSKPFSHNWTGMVLRAFVVHPEYKNHSATYTAAKLLASRFFLPDVYNSRKAASYWLSFQYPFWWNHLVSALDSLSLIGYYDDNVHQALDWIRDHQEENGLFNLNDSKRGKSPGSKKNREQKRWLTLIIYRILKRYSYIV